MWVIPRHPYSSARQKYNPQAEEAEASAAEQRHQVANEPLSLDAPRLKSNKLLFTNPEVGRPLLFESIFQFFNAILHPKQNKVQ